MPIKQERELRKAAKKAGLKPGSPRSDAYVYGTMQKIEERRAAKRRRSR